MPSERPLLITGMHRSGTSLLTSVLAQAGVHLGNELLGPAQGNRRGHFEDVHFLNLQEHALRDAGTSMLLRRVEDIPSPDDEMVEKARNLCAGKDGLWGFKDPRTCLFLDLWLRLLPDAGFVLIFRHPLDVFSSLLRRGTDIEALLDPYTAFDSWAVYNRRLLEFHHVHKERCVLVSLEGAVQDLRSFVTRVSKQLEVPLESQEVEAPFEPSELHHRQKSPRILKRLQELVPESLVLYDELVRRADLPPPAERDDVDEVEGPTLAANQEIASASILSLLEAYEPQALVRREQALLEQLFLRNNPETSAAFPTAIGPLMERHRARNVELEHLTHHLDSLETQLGTQREELEAFERHGKNLEENLAACQGNLEELTQHASNLEQRSSHQAQEIQKLTQLESQLEKSKDDLAELRAHADNLERRCTEQEQQIQEFTAHNNHQETQIDQLSEHANNLEQRCAQKDQQIQEFTAHNNHQETQIDQLSEHANNLEQRCTQKDQQIEDLTAHTANLETLLDRCRGDVDELGEHARNLEEQLARQQTLWEDLRSHARNLEVEIEERNQLLSEFTEHSTNLQKDLEERQRNLDDFVRHSRNLETLRSKQQAQIEALSSELRELAPRTTETN